MIKPEPFFHFISYRPVDLTIKMRYNGYRTWQPEKQKWDNASAFLHRTMLLND